MRHPKTRLQPLHFGFVSMRPKYMRCIVGVAEHTQNAVNLNIYRKFFSKIKCYLGFSKSTPRKPILSPQKVYLNDIKIHFDKDKFDETAGRLIGYFGAINSLGVSSAFT
jgi:hypothetical protein